MKVEVHACLNKWTRSGMWRRPGPIKVSITKVISLIFQVCITGWVMYSGTLIALERQMGYLITPRPSLTRSLPNWRCTLPSQFCPTSLSFSYHLLHISKKISTRGSPLGVQLPVKFRRRSNIRSIAKVSYDDATFHFCWGANVLSLSLSLTTIYLEPRPQNTFGQSWSDSMACNLKSCRRCAHQCTSSWKHLQPHNPVQQWEHYTLDLCPQRWKNLFFTNTRSPISSKSSMYHGSL